MSALWQELNNLENKRNKKHFWCKFKAYFNVISHFTMLGFFEKKNH